MYTFIFSIKYCYLTLGLDIAAKCIRFYRIRFDTEHQHYWKMSVLSILLKALHRVRLLLLLVLARSGNTCGFLLPQKEFPLFACKLDKKQSFRKLQLMTDTGFQVTCFWHDVCVLATLLFYAGLCYLLQSVISNLCVLGVGGGEGWDFIKRMLEYFMFQLELLFSSLNSFQSVLILE